MTTFYTYLNSFLQKHKKLSDRRVVFMTKNETKNEFTFAIPFL